MSASAPPWDSVSASVSATSLEEYPSLESSASIITFDSLPVDTVVRTVLCPLLSLSELSGLGLASSSVWRSIKHEHLLWLSAYERSWGSGAASLGLPSLTASSIREEARARSSLIKAQGRSAEGFLSVLDKLASATVKAEHDAVKARDLADDAMKASFGVGCALLRQTPRDLNNRFAQRAVQLLACWVTVGDPRAQALASFLTDAARSIEDGGDLSDVPWRRSGVKFAIEAAEARENIVVCPTIKSCASLLDNHINDLLEEGASPGIPPPPYLPRSHFWFYPYAYGVGGYHVC
ncbi:F-box domain-containing protein [Pseudoscourfieldia marina]